LFYRDERAVLRNFRIERHKCPHVLPNVFIAFPEQDRSRDEGVCFVIAQSVDQKKKKKGREGKERDVK